MENIMEQNELKKRRNIFLLILGILLLFFILIKVMKYSFMNYILFFFSDRYVVAELSFIGFGIYTVLQFLLYTVLCKKKDTRTSTINKGMYLSFVVCVFPTLAFYGMSDRMSIIKLLFVGLLMLLMVIFPFIKKKEIIKDAFVWLGLFVLCWFMGIQEMLRMESNVEVVKKIDIETAFEIDKMQVYEENAESGVLGDYVLYKIGFNKSDESTYYFCYYKQVETPIKWLREEFKESCLENATPEVVWEDETVTVSYDSEGWYVIERQDTVIVMETNATAEIQNFLEIP